MTTLRILGNDKQAALSTAQDCSSLPEPQQALHCSDTQELNQDQAFTKSVILKQVKLYNK